MQQLGFNNLYQEKGFGILRHFTSIHKDKSLEIQKIIHREYISDTWYFSTELRSALKEKNKQKSDSISSVLEDANGWEPKYWLAHYNQSFHAVLVLTEFLTGPSDEFRHYWSLIPEEKEYWFLKPITIEQCRDIYLGKAWLQTQVRKALKYLDLAEKTADICTKTVEQQNQRVESINSLKEILEDINCKHQASIESHEFLKIDHIVWKTLEGLHEKHSNNHTNYLKSLHRRLKKFTETELKHYHREYWNLHQAIKDTEINEIIYDVIEYSSDDIQEYFLNWVVSLGRDIVTAALENPNLLVDYASEIDESNVLFEELGYAANTASLKFFNKPISD